MFDTSRKRSYPLLKIAARVGTRMGHAASMTLLGAIYESGPEGIEAANALYEQAAERGDTQAMFRLGVNHLPTKGGETDADRAVHWLNRAAEGDNPMAAWALGKMHLAGNPIEKNVGRGLDLLRRSADAGYRPACLSLAQIYRAGSHGVTADDDQAVHWFIQSRPWKDRIRIRLGLARVDIG